MVRGLVPAAAAAAVLSLISPAAMAAAGERDGTGPPVWVLDGEGRRFRVRFEPGHRMLVGAGLEVSNEGGRGATSPAVEVGLFLRSERAALGQDVTWMRDHEIGHLRIRPRGDAAPALEGRLYRGIFLRRSREGSLTIPTTPPLRVPLPFDIGVVAELGRVRGVALPSPGGPGLETGAVHGEVVADFLKSPRQGRFVTLGLGGRYDVGLARDPSGALNLDHQVAPMTALAAAARTESEDGLVAAAMRVEGVHRWSSVRGWEQGLSADGEIEVVPLAINDRPLSLVLHAAADAGGGRDGLAFSALVGVRFAEPLR